MTSLRGMQMDGNVHDLASFETGTCWTRWVHDYGQSVIPGYRDALDRDCNGPNYEKRHELWISAVFLPCGFEKRLIERIDRATGMRRSGEFWKRTTVSFDGYTMNDLYLNKPIPVKLFEYIECACPMPTTFDEAFEEYRHWRWRSFLWSYAYDKSDNGLRVTQLDLLAHLRAMRVRDAVLHGLPATSPEQFRIRWQIHRCMSPRDPRTAERLRRDLATLRAEASRLAQESIDRRTPSGDTAEQSSAEAKSPGRNPVQSRLVPAPGRAAPQSSAHAEHRPPSIVDTTALPFEVEKVSMRPTVPPTTQGRSSDVKSVRRRPTAATSRQGGVQLELPWS